MRGRPRLLTALEQKARPARRGLARHVEGAGLALVHPGVEQLLDEALVDLLVRPAERRGPELAERDGLGARERDVSDPTPVGLGRALNAEAVTFGVTHDGPDLGETS